MTVKTENKEDPVKKKNQVSHCLLNSFLTNVPIFYPLKTQENLRLSGIFRGYKIGTLARNLLIYTQQVNLHCFQKLNVCFCNMFLLAKLWVWKMKPWRLLLLLYFILLYYTIEIEIILFTILYSIKSKLATALPVSIYTEGPYGLKNI